MLEPRINESPGAAAGRDLRVLYVTDGWDGSYRYRVRHGIEQLRASGIPANVYDVTDPELLRVLPAYSLVVLFRLPWSNRVEALLQAIRAQGATAAFEIDDLIFDPSVAPLLPFLPDLPRSAQREYRDRFERLHRTFLGCDVFIGSTPAVVRRAEAFGKPALLHPNLVAPWYETVARATMRLRGMVRRPRTIAYISGSNTHDRDLRAVADALAEVMQRERDVRLFVCGFVDLPPALAGLADRVRQIGYQDWRVYPWALGFTTATIAPMSVVNDFTDGKSALKFFEAGALGVPAVCTPTETFREAISDGVDGFLAADHDAWVAGLRRVLDPIEGPAIGERARRTVLERYTFDAWRDRLAALLRPLAGRATGPVPEPLSVDSDVRGYRRGESGSRLDRVRRCIDFVLDRPSAPGGGSSSGAWVAPSLQPARFERALRALDERGPDALGGEHEVRRVVVGSDGVAGWTVEGDVRPLDGGALDCRDRDPRLTSPGLRIVARRFRYLVVRMRAELTSAGGPAPQAQLFWSDRGLVFTEPDSVRWHVEPDGAMHTYVVDLDGTAWPPGSVVNRLRLDPLDAPGRVHIAGIDLLADLAQLEAGEVAAMFATRWLSGVGLACGAVPAPENAFRIDRQPDGADVVADADRLPVLDGAVDYCAGAGALDEMLRVVRPDGLVLLTGAGDEAVFRARVAATTGTLVEVARDGERLFAAVRRTAPLAPRERPVPERPVDIVVPIYNAREETLACIDSVRRHATGDWRLVLVDDCSPDVELARALDRVAADDARIRLLRNAVNGGFVVTANRGMAEAGDRDVLLLNSDTIVTPGFLDALRRTAYAATVPSIVSPLSNNATIFSVPEWCKANPIPPGHSIDGFAELVATSSLRLRPEIVTAHGFCMYVPATIRRAVGALDEQQFGRGFGEENDFCERARALGYGCRLADDAFVFHSGGASFGDAADLLKEEHYETIKRLHPTYFPRVARFIETNPIQPVHDAVQLALRRRNADQPALLCLLHASFDEPGGGTEYHVRDLLEAARLPRAVVAVPQHDGIHLTEIIDGRLATALHYRIPLAEPPSRFMYERPDVTAALREIVREFRIGAAHLHQLCNWPVDAWRTLRELGVPYVATFQDFFPVCPNVNLWDEKTDRLCCLATVEGGPTPDQPGCLDRHCAVFGHEPFADPMATLVRHREEFRGLLESAEAVFFPAERTRDIIGRFFDLGRVRVRLEPHGYIEPTRRMAPSRTTKERLDVALLGAVAHPIKGSRNYLPLLQSTRDLPLTWHVFGDADHAGFADQLRASGLGSRLRLHGRYKREDIFELLVANDIDLVVFLPPWPETFSYTLSEALCAGVPVLVTNQGALTERVHASGAGIVVDTVAEADAALRRLVAAPAELQTLRAAAVRHRHRSLDEMAGAYRPVYDRMLAAAPSPAPLDVLERRTLAVAYQAGQHDAPDGEQTPAPPPVLLPHYTRSWYRLYLPIARLVPEGVRRWGRERMAQRWWRTVQTYDFSAAQSPVTESSGLELLPAPGRGATFRVTDDTAFLVLRAQPFPTRDVRVIRFEMRCRAPGARYAQLYWSHASEERFHEEKSLRIPIAANGDGWCDYTVCIDQTDRRALWDEGDEIRQLRLDPVDVRGTVQIRALRLCAPRTDE